MATDTQHAHIVAKEPARPPVAGRPRWNAADGGLKGVLARALAKPHVRFILHYLEMQVAMEVGMILFSLALLGLNASPANKAAFARGTDLWILGHGLFMAAPMVAWLVLRRHGWRHSLEMGASMIVPAALVILLCWLGAETYAPWLRQIASGLMTVSMVGYMLVQYKHFSGHPGHAAQPA